jgi:hypothetical protein
LASGSSLPLQELEIQLINSLEREGVIPLKVSKKMVRILKVSYDKLEGIPRLRD